MPYSSSICTDPNALRDKVSRFTGELASYWNFFLQRAKLFPVEHPIDNALAYLVTGDPVYGLAFRREFGRMIANLPLLDLSNQAQYHQWTNALPLTRWVLAYDLVADADIFSEQDRAQAAEALLRFCARHYFTVARSRIQTGDNQFFAVALACLVFGHLFGYARGRSALGQEMADYGSRRVPDALGSLPQGGYSGEGYYHNQVVAPLAALYCAFREGTGNAALFDYHYDPNRVSVHDVLLVDYHTILPGGLMVPWDAGYIHRVHIKMNLAYLARQTSDPRFLAPIVHYRMFEGDPRPGWGRDDDFWTWLWWPDSVTDFAQIPLDGMGSWANPRVAFGLYDFSAETGLLQNFDFSERRSSPGASRAQSDPNNVVLVGHGVPLVLDGGFPELPDDATPPERRGMAVRTGVGYHNCIVFDGEWGYSTVQEHEGTLTAFVDTPVLAMGEADVTPRYQDYGVAQVIRRTLQIDQGTYMIADRIVANAPHDVTWQMYVRPYARQVGEQIHVETPEAVRLTLIPPVDSAVAIQQVIGRPVVLEDRTDLVSATRHGAMHHLYSLLKVDALSVPVADIADGWEVARDAAGDARAKGWQHPGSAWPAGGAIDLLHTAAIQQRDIGIEPLPQRFIWDYMDRRYSSEGGGWYDTVTEQGAIWLRRSFAVPSEAAGKRLYLRMSKPTWYFRLYLDGEQIAGTDIDSPTLLGMTDVTVPAVIELSPAAMTGQQHTLVLQILRPYPTTAMGEVTLEVADEPAPVSMQALAPGAFRLQQGEQRWETILANPEHHLRTIGPLATDADCAVIRPDGSWAAFGATQVALDGATILHARYGCASVSYADGELTIAAIDPSAVVELNLPEGRLLLWEDALTQASALLTRPLRVRVAPRKDDASAPALACRLIANIQRQGNALVCELQPAALRQADLTQLAGGDAAAREQAVYAIAMVADARATEALRAALHDPRWTVQAAAAYALGQRMDRTVVPDLLAALDAENSQDVYAGILEQHAFPEWPGGSNQQEMPDLAALPVNAGEIPEPGAVPDLGKRWRVKQAVIEALGWLGDMRAVPVLVSVLDGSYTTRENAGLGMTGLDFYPVRKAAAEALGLIGGAEGLAALHRFTNETEVNARYAAQHGVSWLEHGVIPQEYR